MVTIDTVKGKAKRTRNSREAKIKSSCRKSAQRRGEKHSQANHEHKKN
jgi:hypothetical protein